MERPTPALHLSRITLDLRQLRAEPHTKEVGHVEVYNHRRFRSARGDHGGRGLTAGTSDAGAAHVDVRRADDSSFRGAPAAARPPPVLLRSRALWLRVAARAGQPRYSL